MFSIHIPQTLVHRREAEQALDFIQKTRLQLAFLEVQASLFLLEPIFLEYPELTFFQFNVPQAGEDQLPSASSLPLSHYPPISNTDPELSADMMYFISSNLWDSTQPRFLHDLFEMPTDLTEAEEEDRALVVSLYQDLEQWIHQLSPEAQMYLASRTFTRPSLRLTDTPLRSMAPVTQVTWATHTTTPPSHSQLADPQQIPLILHFMKTVLSTDHFSLWHAQWEADQLDHLTPSPLPSRFGDAFSGKILDPLGTDSKKQKRL